MDDPGAYVLSQIIWINWLLLPSSGNQQAKTYPTS